jgi:hypothetical protein
MKKNVIILTGGLSGSSVLAGLIARGGWWVGDETFKKADYNTYENKSLIDINRQLFEQLGYEGNYEMVYDPADIGLFADHDLTVDVEPFQHFLAECNSHMPWLWKDPRLWLTIHRWVNYLDVDQIKFINLTRDPVQAWISLTIRRQIQEFGYSKSYINGIRDSIRKFLIENNMDYIELEYEDLLRNPDGFIDRLNAFLDSSLDISDLRAIYKGKLYKKPKKIFDLFKASLIYAKNYRRRYR